MVLVSERCGEDGERLQQVLWMKDALELEEVVRKGIWVKNECRQEEQSQVREVQKGVWVFGGQLGSPLPLLPCFGVMRDRARSSGSGWWSLEGKNPAAQHAVHRGYPWSSHMGMNICVNGSHGTQDLLVQVLRPLPS